MPTLKEKLNSIRALVDVDVTGVVIDDIVEHGKKLIAMMGLSSECKAAAKKELDNALLAALITIENKKYSPSVQLKIAGAMCADENAEFEYADRLNAAITHQVEYLRSVISLHKQELHTSLQQI